PARDRRPGLSSAQAGRERSLSQVSVVDADLWQESAERRDHRQLALCDCGVADAVGRERTDAAADGRSGREHAQRRCCKCNRDGFDGNPTQQRSTAYWETLMRVTILPADNVIFIDGKGKALNCMTLRSKQISFVRWHGSRGEIRYADGGERT